MKKLLQWLYLNDSIPMCANVPVNSMQCRVNCGPCVVRNSTFNMIEGDMPLTMLCMANLLDHIASTRREVKIY